MTGNVREIEDEIDIHQQPWRDPNQSYKRKIMRIQENLISLLPKSLLVERAAKIWNQVSAQNWSYDEHDFINPKRVCWLNVHFCGAEVMALQGI